MKLKIEMQEGKDYESQNIKTNVLKELFEKRIRFLLKLRNTDNVKIKLNRSFRK